MSDKFALHVLDLTQIELATDEDCLYGIDHWARLFKAKTWEDLCMVVEQNEYMDAAAEEIYRRNADENIKDQCFAREEYFRRQRWIKETLEKQRKELDEKTEIIAQKDRALAEKDRIIAELRAMQKNQ